MRVGEANLEDDFLCLYKEPKVSRWLGYDVRVQEGVNKTSSFLGIGNKLAPLMQVKVTGGATSNGEEVDYYIEGEITIEIGKGGKEDKIDASPPPKEEE